MTLGELMHNITIAQNLSKRIQFQTERMLQYPIDHPTCLQLREHIITLQNELKALQAIEIK